MKRVSDPPHAREPADYDLEVRWQRRSVFIHVFKHRWGWSVFSITSQKERSVPSGQGLDLKVHWHSKLNSFCQSTVTAWCMDYIFAYQSKEILTHPPARISAGRGMLPSFCLVFPLMKSFTFGKKIIKTNVESAIVSSWKTSSPAQYFWRIQNCR